MSVNRCVYLKGWTETDGGSYKIHYATNVKVFWSSRNRSFVFNQIFVYGTLMGVDYKSEKKI